MRKYQTLLSKLFIIFIAILLPLLSIVYAANPSFITKLYMIEGSAGANFTGQLQLSADTSHNLYKIHPDGTSKQMATGDQAVGTGDSPTFASQTVTGTTTLASSLNGYLYATNGAVSTFGNSAASIALTSELTNSPGASATLTAGSNSNRGEITVNTGSGRGQIQTITVNSLPSVNDTLIYQNAAAGTTRTLTFIAGASSGNSVHIEADTTTQAATIASRIVAQDGGSLKTTTSSGNVVTQTWLAPGTAAGVNGSQSVGATLSFATTQIQSPVSGTTASTLAVATITFGDTFVSTPYVFFQKENANGASTFNPINRSTTGFSVTATEGLNFTYLVQYFTVR